MILLPVTPHGPAALDDLFDDPDRGIMEEDEAIGDETDPARDSERRNDEEERDGDHEDERRPAPPVQGVDIAALTTSPPRFSGSVDTGAGISLGMREWPGTEAAGDDEPLDLLVWRAVYDMTTTLRLTARPRPHIRFTGALKTELNETDATFSTPAVSNLFVDYTLHDRYFFRAGKYSMTWGQARILKNIGNLAEGISDGVAIRLIAPVGPGTMTGAVYTRAKEITEQAGGAAGNPRAFTYLGQYETTRGRVSTGLAGRARAGETLDTSAYVTLGLGALDLTQEAVARWNRQDPFSEESLDFATLSQFVWEFGSPVWRVIGEYGYDHAVANNEGHRIGVGVRMPQFLPGNWRPQIRWRHAFVDDSGQVETAFTGRLAPDLEGTIGIPILYGKPGTIYRGADTDIPDNGVISLLVGARLTFSF